MCYLSEREGYNRTWQGFATCPTLGQSVRWCRIGVVERHLVLCDGATIGLV